MTSAPAEATRALQTVPETELKLTVPDGVDLDLQAAAGGAVAAVAPPTVAVLRTTYFDTADLRLARSGLTLRQRLGDDEGWHLKVPAGPKAGTEGRQEIRTDPGGTTPPQQLLDLVRAYLRGAPVRAVATLETTRATRRLLADGGAELGVVVDDAVRVLDGEQERGRFREVEVEAAPSVAEPGPLLAAVAGRLTAAGAVLGEQRPKVVQALGAAAQQPPDPPRPEPVGPTDSAAAAVTAHLRAQAHAFLRNDVGVRRDLPDAVHQMRVAARRFRSTLRTFRPLLDADAAIGLADELAWAADVLGEVRDREVLLARLEGHVRDLPLAPGDREALTDCVAGTLRAELAAARQAVLDALHGPRYDRLVDRLVATATAPPLTPAAAEPAARALPPLLAAARDALHRRAGRLTSDSGDAAYHRARIAAKRARYAGELTSAVLGEPARALARAAEAVQEVLGEHQDAVVAAAAAADLLRPESPAPVAFGLGMLTAYERSAARRARDAFPAVWRTVEQLGGQGVSPPS